MPEGAEVRRCRDIIHETIYGKYINFLEPISGKLFRTGIKGPCLRGKVTNVYVKGKVIIIETDSGNSIVSTLGMSGWWYPSSKQLSTSQSKQRAHYNNTEVETGKIIETAEHHTRARIICADNTILNYTDMRNFGNLYVTDINGVKQKLNSLGSDLLNETISLTNWVSTWRQKKHSNKQIGAALLEQGIFCGLGNIYRAETCYLAGVNPFSKVSDLTDIELEKLLIAAVHTLDVAYKMGKSVDPNSTGYSLKVFENLMSEERMSVLKTNLCSRMNMKWDDIREYGYYGRLMVYGQKVSPINELVDRDSLGGRTIWFVKNK